MAMSPFPITPEKDCGNAQSFGCERGPENPLRSKGRLRTHLDEAHRSELEEGTLVEMNLGTYKSGYYNSAYPYARHLAAARARFAALPRDISGEVDRTSWPPRTNTHMSWLLTPAAPRPVYTYTVRQMPSYHRPSHLSRTRYQSTSILSLGV